MWSPVLIECIGLVYFCSPLMSAGWRLSLLLMYLCCVSGCYRHVLQVKANLSAFSEPEMEFAKRYPVVRTRNSGIRRISTVLCV